MSQGIRDHTGHKVNSAVYIGPVPNSEFQNKLAFVAFVTHGRPLSKAFPEKYRQKNVQPLFDGQPETLHRETIICKKKRNN